MKSLNPKRGDTIRFLAMNDYTGKNESLEGKVIGKGREVRKMYPIECALCPENYSLVKRIDPLGTVWHYVVIPEDMEAILPTPKEAL